MSISSDYSLSDIAAATGNNGNNNGIGWGGDWVALIVVFFLFSMFGWGGFGGFGGFSGFGGGYRNGYGSPCATQADVRAAVDQQTLISKIDQQTYGMAESFTALNNTLNNNFRGIDNAICTLGYQGAQHANNLSAQMASCCCDTRAAIKDVDAGIERAGWNLSKQISDCCCTVERQIERGFADTNYNLATQNCATLSAIDKVGDRIIDYMANEKMQTLRDENQALRLAASQERQNQFIISQLGYQCPKPAYVVQPPQQVTFPTNCCGGVNYAGYNNGCGCGCGCN